MGGNRPRALPNQIFAQAGNVYISAPTWSGIIASIEVQKNHHKLLGDGLEKKVASLALWAGSLEELVGLSRTCFSQQLNLCIHLRVSFS